MRVKSEEVNRDLTAAQLLKDRELLVLNEQLELLGKRPLPAKLAYLQLYGVALDQVGFHCEVVSVQGLKVFSLHSLLVDDDSTVEGDSSLPSVETVQEGNGVLLVLLLRGEVLEEGVETPGVRFLRPDYDQNYQFTS